ncbi:MAG: F0F1 ATP synthase subunit A [Bacteroidia bacterium]
MRFTNFFRFNSLSISLFAAVFALSFFTSSSTQAAETPAGEEESFDITSMILHHIADAHDWHLFDLKNEDGSLHPVSIPLPVILLTDGKLDVFMSSAFDHGHAEVSKGDRTYKLNHGHVTETSGLKVLDFSITKNVASMLLSVLLLVWIFIAAARSYSNSVPTGLARFMEPLVLFVRDEIAIPNIGEKHHKRFMPYLLTVFFFIWINNLLGLIPAGANFTGNIAVTLTLAVITMIITNLNGTKTYWGHIFTPHVPKALWFIMIPVELIGVISKPFALTVRLFANITAGHIIILSLVSLIFIFKSVFIAPVSVGFVLFMSFLELLVAALQAYVFTLLSALFIGLALEEPHHDHEHAH